MVLRSDRIAGQCHPRSTSTQSLHHIITDQGIIQTFSFESSRPWQERVNTGSNGKRETSPVLQATVFSRVNGHGGFMYTRLHGVDHVVPSFG